MCTAGSGLDVKEWLKFRSVTQSELCSRLRRFVIAENVVGKVWMSGDLVTPRKSSRSRAPFPCATAKILRESQPQCQHQQQAQGKQDSKDGGENEKDSVPNIGKYHIFLPDPGSQEKPDH